MFSAGYAVRAAHEAPPGRLLPLLSRHQPLCNDRLQWVDRRRSRMTAARTSTPRSCSGATVKVDRLLTLQSRQPDWRLYAGCCR